MIFRTINTPTTITSTELQRKIGEITRRAAKEGIHFIVERDGFPALAVISVTEYHLLLQDRKHLHNIIRSIPAQVAEPSKSQSVRRSTAKQSG